MHIFRWLLVHPIAFAWILAVIAILLNWMVGGKPPEQGAGKHAKSAEVSHGQPQKAVEAHAKAAAGTDQAAQTAAGGGEGVQQQGAAVASASIAEQAAVASVPAVSEAVANGSAQQAAAPSAESSAEDLLLAAREAYWAGELERSVGFYQSLLQKENKPDYKGELANVYWKQGNSAEAVALFAEVAPWLAQQGRMAELKSIKVYADLVDPVKAAEIGALLK